MGQRERVKRYKTEGAAAGLVRVEVLVPPEDRDAIVSLAARLRQNHRQQADLVRLHQAAMSRFGARCLWSAKPPATPEGMKVVADHLRKYGGMDAWRLAEDIAEVLTHAAR